MKFGSVCSGIEAASVAWPFWQPAWFSEIEPFPCAVLKHHYPDVPNYGDMTQFQEWNDEPIDLLCGGTPCQSFSMAGLRTGLCDPRGNLMLTYLAIANKYRPEWLIWENVEGVLSANRGRDFGVFLGGLAAIGYGFAYRLLDARNFDTSATRRFRVFVVANRKSWKRAAKTLFEPQSLEWANKKERGEGHRLPMFTTCQGGVSLERLSQCFIEDNGRIRYLTSNEALECMGFPRDYLDGIDGSESARIKAIGNSWAVPVVRWIGERINNQQGNTNE